MAEYIKGNPGAGVRVASALGIAPAYLSQMAHGHRPFPPQLCPRIVAITEGAVRHWHLRPGDWHLIWPELVAHPDAPAIPAEAGAA